MSPWGAAQLPQQEKAEFHPFVYSHLAPGVAQLALLHCGCKIQEGLNPLVLKILSMCAPKTAFPEVLSPKAISCSKEQFMIHQNKTFPCQKKHGGVKRLGSQTNLECCPKDCSRENNFRMNSGVYINNGFSYSKVFLLKTRI